MIDLNKVFYKLTFTFIKTKIRSSNNENYEMFRTLSIGPKLDRNVFALLPSFCSVKSESIFAKHSSCS